MRAHATHQPAHARPTTSGHPGRRRRFPAGLLIVAAIYAAAIGFNEWRLHRHVQAVRASQTTFIDAELDPRTAELLDVAPGPSGGGR